MATPISNLQSGNRAAEKPKGIFEYLKKSQKLTAAIEAVAGQYFTPERFIALAVNAVKKTPRLQECQPLSVLGAFMAAASLPATRWLA